MFKNEFQGGKYVELFTVQGKDPLGKLKTSRNQANIQKIFDNDLRSFVVFLEGEPSQRNIKFPKKKQQSLHAIQPYLIIQIQVNQPFGLELTISDTLNQKQRLVFSSSTKEIVFTAFHVKMPCPLVESNIWLNLCFDLDDLVKCFFNGARFSVLNNVIISGNIRLKRLFTLKDSPLSIDEIPKNFRLNIDEKLLVVNSSMFIDADINVRNGSARSTNKKALLLTDFSPGFRFAPPVSNLIDASDSLTDRTQRVKKQHSCNGSKTDRPLKAYKLNTNQEDAIKPKLKSYSRILQEDILPCNKVVMQPKPPKNSPGKVRKPRVKSADASIIKSHLQKHEPLSKSADTRRRINSDRSETCYNRRYEGNSLIKVQRFKSLDGLTPRTISKSVLDLETVEQRISGNRWNHFRSKSLTVLPDIKSNTESKPTFPILLLADDTIEDTYLFHSACSNDNESDSISESSCCTSSNSDFVLPTPRSHRSVVENVKNKVNSEKGSLENINFNTESSSGVSSSIKSLRMKNEHRASNMDATYIVNDITEERCSSVNESGYRTVLPSYSKAEESFGSDAIAWLNTAQNHVNKVPIQLESSPKLSLRMRLEEKLGSMIFKSNNADTDDGFSDGSDDATLGDRSKMHNYRYQDEFQNLDATLDLSATIPETPQVGDQSRVNSDVNNNKVSRDNTEEYLDLMFDPVLNCYYDPKSHKYYELS